ncbi:MAG TPA: ATPase [Elusimicrobia bacterium]|nr:ATPase [Elusimicrobiota bacterium]HBT61271.1 ATPase [Elusimicrobiota bacterium]
MNKSHSGHESSFLPRWLAPALGRAIADHPVVVLTGARQVGKSTLLEHAEPTKHWKYVTFDNSDAMRQGKRDPEGLWAGTDRVILDEVQRLPGILSAVKEAVDAHPGKMRFALSGSANILLMRQVSESLAGRAVHLTLLPMAAGEMLLRPPPSCLSEILSGRFPREERLAVADVDPFSAIFHGFMPRLLALPTAEGRTRWWEGYAATYLERDLRDLSQVESLSDFRTVMEILALRAAQMVNQTEVARDSHVSQPTVHRYLNLLETTCLIDRLPAFARNRTKRLIKAPKLHWVDPALAAYLGGLNDEDSIKAAREAGALFENLIFHHLKVLAGMFTPQLRIYYWRTVKGEEVDFVLEWGRKIVAVEVKLTCSPRYADCEGLEAFLKDHPEASGGILIHIGRDVVRLGTKIVALPWTALAGA